MNVRIPERAMGDFRAQIAAVKTGERRFLELLDALWPRTVLTRIDSIKDTRSGGPRAHALHPGRHVRGRILHGR